MRFADALVTKRARIETRAMAMAADTFADIFPAHLERATILEATAIYDFLLPQSERLAELPRMKVLPPWHVTFVEMCTMRARGLYAGVFFLREDDRLDACLVMGNTNRAMTVATFHSRLDPSTGCLVGETQTGVVPGDERKSQVYLGAYAVGLYSFAFAHCKNVNVVEQVLSKVETGMFKRKHCKMPLRYHILDIKPLVKRVREESGEGTEINRALHICRGHFRTYSEQRKLFGKIAGTFWVDEHARGAEEFGTVVKDYNIPVAA